MLIDCATESRKFVMIVKTLQMRIVSPAQSPSVKNLRWRLFYHVDMQQHVLIVSFGGCKRHRSAYSAEHRLNRMLLLTALLFQLGNDVNQWRNQLNRCHLKTWLGFPTNRIVYH
jgi:hypothetical protein